MIRLSVREMLEIDIERIVDYFVDADAEFLKGMGADKSKMPERKQWIEKLQAQNQKPYGQKDFFYVIWLIDNQPTGHSNINTIDFGKSAVMHLHLWNGDKRKKGLGLEFLKMSIPYYFRHFELDYLVCEPYAENIAPNKVLKRIGFEFKRTYETTPGWINFHQRVNRYELTRAQFEKIV